MRRLPDGSFRFSPRDLIAYLEGDFAAWCDRYYAEHPGTTQLAPDERDDEMDLVVRYGFAHEAAYLATLKAREPALVDIARNDDAHDATLRAMRGGAPIITQAELRAEPWMGIADILHRRDGTSHLGDHFYEPWDTKLARSAKPYFLLQLVAYAEMLEQMQGVRPAQFGFVFGDGTETPFATRDVWHYYQQLKQDFEAFHAGWLRDSQPDAALDRSFGKWSTYAEGLLAARDDLSLVAGITRSQVIRLRDAGIDTVAKLASHDGSPIPHMSETTLANLHAQAVMQVRSREKGKVEWKFRDVDPDRPRRGLALLPPPSPNDVFFDIEGFPYAPKGLEYLLGVVTVDTRAPVFRDWWAHDAAEERKAFEAFVDWAHARWKADPSAHIYHYAAYEKTALCRLMSQYGTRENEVDDLLRHNVLVDLYPVVLQSMVIGIPSYSLKQVEHLYMPPRAKDGVTTAGGSVVEYQRWMDSGESRLPSESPILTAIRDYNRIDCESTVLLRDWLLARQAEAGISYIVPEEPKEDAGDDTPAGLLAKSLLARAEAMPLESEKRRTTELFAWLLEFHRREDKPWWWKHFDMMSATEQALYDEMDALAGLERTSTPPRSIKRSTGFEYRFDPNQETKLREGESCALAWTENLKCTIERYVDRDAGLIELKIGAPKTLPGRLALIPGQPMPNKTLRDAILRFVTRWSEDASRHPALLDLIGRSGPRLSGSPSRLAINEDAELAPQAIDAARRLDHSTLCIQGPPGTGKTSIAADIIIALVGDGKRVGIVANNHEVILNLLDRVHCCAEEAGVALRLVKVGKDEQHPLIASGAIEPADSGDAADIIAEGPLVIGGTAWLFSREELDDSLDYLFIEEAGQFALANTIAVASAARNLILLGDQMQLSQPTQGSHPGESGLSTLSYLLQDHATVPPKLGIFLGRTWRMHPAICALISEAYYDSRLKSADGAKSHRIIGGERTSIGIESGVRFMPIDHDGCTQASDEEVCTIIDLVNELLACRVTVKGRAERPMELNDILIVAPFNMQVRRLKERIPGARVGTVDKFQGQEAPVVIVSMCASTVHDAPRGPKFLLEKNRLNVALSRAQALAVVVGSSSLANTRVRSVDELYLLNGWCRIAEFVSSREQSG